MKYEEEYKQSKDRDNFIKILLKKYKQIKPATALRRYYDLRKEFGKVTKSVIKKEEITKSVSIPTNIVRKHFIKMEGEVPPSKPSHMKILMLQEMLERNYILTNDFLKRHGFKSEEINWIKEDLKC